MRSSVTVVVVDMLEKRTLSHLIVDCTRTYEPLRKVALDAIDAQVVIGRFCPLTTGLDGWI
jgi:hypothetical protein